jgi:hypothetical protein
MSFLDNYEDVATRIKRLHATHPTNRVETSIVDFNAQAGFILVECRIYREYEDEKPSAIDYAFGRVESYNTQMKRWFVEDTVTSAIGRCAGLLLGTDERPTRQNMIQAESMPVKFVNAEVEDLWAQPFGEVTVTKTESGFTAASQAINDIKTQLGGEIASESPICAHGHMILKEGMSPKTGKPYRGYVCTEKTKTKQCSPMWMTLTSDGSWKAQI